MQQVEDQVAGVEDVVAAPGLAQRFVGHRAVRPDDYVVVRGCRASLNGASKLASPLAGSPLGSAPFSSELIVGRDQLDVAELLGRDVRDQRVVLAELVAAAEVERLVHVVHERRHLAEAPAEQLLHGRRRVRVRLGRRRHFNL